MIETQERQPGWWGRFEVPEGETRHWTIGPLDLWIRHRPHEWRIAYRASGELAAPALGIARPATADEVPEDTEGVRFASQRPGSAVRLTPALADRPVVTRPETPFHLLPGDEVSLFVSTPLWVRIDTQEPARLLLEVPTYRPPDTWFGPSTLEGELCYASRTEARIHFQNLSPAVNRATTQVRLVNRAEDDLVLERMSLPVPELALFEDLRGLLWTQAVVVERHGDGQLAEVRYEGQPPAEAGGVTRIAEPRSEVSRNVLVRALGALLR